MKKLSKKNVTHELCINAGILDYPTNKNNCEKSTNKESRVIKNVKIP